MIHSLLFVLGTRPEAIKLAPLIFRLRNNASNRVFVCNTGQQSELSAQALGYFGLSADCNLDSMRHGQTLEEVQGRIMAGLADLHRNQAFDAVIVQGDTISAFCGALSGFYQRVPVFHVEAGLRSYNLDEPFPEEGLRQLISRIASLHFAPTEKSRQHLLHEGIAEDAVYVTGNTVIDALYSLPEAALGAAYGKLAELGIEPHDKIVLLTAHRRENHGQRLHDIIGGVLELAGRWPDHQFICPVHPNPKVHDTIYAALGGIRNVTLTKPLDYPELVAILKIAKLVLTDSGGIQEEAPCFGSPVLVLRHETERMEGIAAGMAKLVGTDRDVIVAEANSILGVDKSASRLDVSRNPYGQGQAASTIESILGKYWPVDDSKVVEDA
ncbi:UDP-N-acetylglucosamine 2-epimerase (non-hydrolyzing) [Desulfovibrio sp. OttesenSCG-928-I05]|nr:UDP-N-acetylglucosamine 2-epimerase (non-hydrolyzing) [Desulfovibrio sp. OttesenSCG-928-I05]